MPGAKGTGQVLSEAAASTTSCPAAVNPRARRSTTLSMPPYPEGGMGIQGAAISPIRMLSSAKDHMPRPQTWRVSYQSKAFA
jgi:hypothetical protein